jgi:hypothetical protein
VTLEDPDIGSTEPNVRIDNNCPAYTLLFGMAGGSADYNDDGDESDDLGGFPTDSRRVWHVSELEGIDLGPSDV